ncbi:DUF4215 domain-containing protein [Patescibacteria group bacterium]
MKSNISLTKRISAHLLFLIMGFTMIMPEALAATLYFKDNSGLIEGCDGTVEIMMDTEGKGVFAADTTINFNSSEITFNSMSVGSPLPMETFNNIIGTMLQLSGSRFGGTGGFTGIGTFGTIDLEPKMGETGMTLTFGTAPNDNLIVDAATLTDILTSTSNKTFSINERYNKEVDGVGFCNPDTTPPTVNFILPPNGSGGNPVDTNVVFSLTDDRAGVDINSLTYTIKGVGYTNTSSQTTVDESSGVYRVETDPVANFAEGENVSVRVTICDANTNPGPNCTTRNGSFRTYEPPPPDPVCGDGIPTYSVGEQCDDGNTTDGDGCSSLCLWEAPPSEPTEPTPPAEPLECPEPEPCPECVYEEEEEVVELHEAAEIPEEPIPGCTRKEVVASIIDKFELEERFAAKDKACLENWDNCMLPFKIHSSHNANSSSYYPDVFTTTSGPLLEGEAAVSQNHEDGILFATRSRMVQGYYEEAGSPFKPNQNTRRREVIKMLNWSVLGQEWEYYDEYVAKIGGEQNLDNVAKSAADLNEWWEPPYYNLACEIGVLACDPAVKQRPAEVCNPTWLNNTMAEYYAYYKNLGDTGFEDTDNDTIIDRDESFIFLTNPESEDTDNDDLNDGDELTLYNSNPLLTDTDYDNISDGDEVNTYGTDPTKSDTDGDSFTDGVEIALGSDPTDAADFPQDANGNGIDDAWELQYGISTQNGSDDFDGDGLSNLLEYRHNTDPTNPDTDGDGLLDGEEVLVYRTDPNADTNLNDAGVRFTNIKDGTILTELKPFFQGFGSIPGAEIKIYLRNEFGHEVLIGTTAVDDNNVFTLQVEEELLDGEFYVLAKMLDPDNRQVLESPLISVSLDSSLSVQEPKPERLSTETITDEIVLEGLEVIIKDDQPMLLGKTGPNYEVSGIWESVIGASGIVSDLTTGEFRLQAPKSLGKGEHKVSVYAVRPSDGAMSKLVVVNFVVKEPLAQVLHGIALGEELIFPGYVWLLIFIVGIGLIFTGIYLKRKAKGKKK